jgi:PKD domain
VPLVLVAAVLCAVTTLPAAQAAAGDAGHLDASYAGAQNPPTSDKPQSKLWWNDGSWWADMFDTTSSTWHIFRLDRATETWVDTGVPLDTRTNSLADTLWDGAHLYVASHYVTVSSQTSPKASLSGKPSRLYRFSYSPATRTYTLNPGYPSQISNVSSESLTIDKDSRGLVWATWTQVSGSAAAGFTSAVYVNATVGGDQTWGTPQVLPVAGSAPAPDDISAVVAYSGTKIGVLWSNQLDDSVYWAIHNDGDPATTWRGSVARHGPHLADDHMNLKTIQADAAGRVFAAVKTSADEATPVVSSAAQLDLLVLKPGTGSWSATTFGTVADCHTRPLVMLDTTSSRVHVFATAPTASGCPFSGAPGSIYEKSAPLGNPVFPAGRGTPVIRDAASANMNNVTSSKQSVTAASGLVVLASNDVTKRYWHADLSLGVATAPTASFTASPTTGTAPLSVQLTDTSTGGPTSWSWNLGNGTTTTAQNPTAVYSAAGTYPVTLTASNAAGASAPVSRTITVKPATTAGVRRESVATTNVTTVAAGITVSTPTGTVAGDVLVSCLALNGGGVASAGAPAGWTLLAAATSQSNPKVYGYVKVATASEPASYGWKFSSSVVSSGGIARYSGSAGVDGAATKAGAASGTTATVPGVTNTVASELVVGCMGVNSGGTSVTLSPPAGLTRAWDGTAKRHQVADGTQPAAGAGPDRTWTFSASRAWAGWLVALRPA